MTASSSTCYIPQPVLPPQPIPSLRPPFPLPPLPGGIGIPPPLSLATPITSQASAPSVMFRPRMPFPSYGGPRYPGSLTDTVIIRKIPRALNTVTKLSSHFEKFGTIVNLTVSVIYVSCQSGGTFSS